MENAGRLLMLLGLVMLTAGLLFNLMPHWPKIPGDFYIDRPNIKIYIPFTSAIIISILLTLVFNLFNK